jgi:hypothetical protein
MDLREDINILVDELESGTIDEEEFKRLLEAVLAEYSDIKNKEKKYGLRDN